MAVLTEDQQNAIRDEVDAAITKAILPILTKAEAEHPDALISVPRQVVVGQKAPPKSRIVHKGDTRPVTKEDTARATAGKR